MYHWELDISASSVQVSDGHESYGRLMSRDKSVINAPVLGTRFGLSTRPGSENRGVTTWYQSMVTVMVVIFGSHHHGLME